MKSFERGSFKLSVPTGCIAATGSASLTNAAAHTVALLKLSTAGNQFNIPTDLLASTGPAGTSTDWLHAQQLSRQWQSATPLRL